MLLGVIPVIATPTRQCKLPTMKQLESLEAWKGAQRSARLAYRLTMRPPLERHFGLSDQIRRAAVSIPANIVEGYALGTTPQFLRHLKIALGSAAELQCHLRIASDLSLVENTKETAVTLDRTIRLLVGLIRKLTRSSQSPFPNPQSPHGQAARSFTR